MRYASLNKRRCRQHDMPSVELIKGMVRVPLKISISILTVRRRFSVRGDGGGICIAMLDFSLHGLVASLLVEVPTPR